MILLFCLLVEWPFFGYMNLYRPVDQPLGRQFWNFLLNKNTRTIHLLAYLDLSSHTTSAIILSPQESGCCLGFVSHNL